MANWWRSGWLLLLCALALVSFVEGKAGWHDPNIISIGHHWEHLDMDKILGHPPPPVDDKHLKNETSIVILIASLRETRLVDTLLSIFDNAAHPSRVHVGVVQQNDKNDDDIVQVFCERRGHPVQSDTEGNGFVNVNGCKEFDNIRVIRMDVSEAAGPVYARARQAELVRPEDDFCFQIDAHTIFKVNWDMLILREWGFTQNEFAVLTTYPTNYKHLYQNSNNHWEMPHLCDASIQRGIVHNKQAKAVANLDRPLLSPLWAAGMSFSRCHAERDVPNDIHLRHIFTGEEYGRGVRLWTHGYDFYSITRPIIGTYYGSEKGGRGGWRSDGTQMRLSTKRLRTLVENRNSDQSPEALEALGKYRLGTRRTLDQYIEFSGLDPRNDDASNMKCIVEYVPWKDTEPKQATMHRHPPRKSLSVSKEDYKRMKEASERRLQAMPCRWCGLIFVVVLILCYLGFRVCCKRNRTVWEKNLRAVRKLRLRKTVD